MDFIQFIARMLFTCTQADAGYLKAVQLIEALTVFLIAKAGVEESQTCQIIPLVTKAFYLYI